MIRPLRHVAWTLCAIAGTAAAQRDFSKVEIAATDLGHGLHMLTGAGGNIVVSAGSDGVFIVDDQYAPLTDRISAAVAKISDKPVRFVINTHWHGDHTGGNENFGKRGAVVLAHDNVHTRMSSEQFIALFKEKVPASPAAALPVVTFNDQLSLRLNGDNVRAIHVAAAHTDGDALVHFTDANVLHMGDVWFNGNYPFIDTSSGGSIDGYLAAVARGVALANDSTKIVPGHGPLGTRAQLAAYGELLKGIRDRIAALKREGKTLAETQAAKPTAASDETFGRGFIKPDQLVEAIYSSLR